MLLLSPTESIIMVPQTSLKNSHSINESPNSSLKTKDFTLLAKSQSVNCCSSRVDDFAYTDSGDMHWFQRRNGPTCLCCPWRTKTGEKYNSDAFKLRTQPSAFMSSKAKTNAWVTSKYGITDLFPISLGASNLFGATNLFISDSITQQLHSYSEIVMSNYNFG